jgi:hypothetical protein
MSPRIGNTWATEDEDRRAFAAASGAGLYRQVGHY